MQAARALGGHKLSPQAYAPEDLLRLIQLLAESGLLVARPLLHPAELFSGQVQRMLRLTSLGFERANARGRGQTGISSVWRAPRARQLV